MNPAKLKVVELRAELASRGLDTKGVKAVLVERLQEALNEENGGAPPPSDDGKGDEGDSEAPLDDTQMDEEAPQEADEPAKEPEPKPVPPAQKTPEKPPAPAQKSPEKSPALTQSPVKPAEAATPEKAAPATPKKEEEAKVDVKKEIKTEPDAQSDADVKSVTTNGIKTEGGETKMDTSDVKEEDKKEDRKRKRSASPKSRGPPPEQEPEIDGNAVTLSWYDSDLHLTVDNKTFFSAKPLSSGGFGYLWAGVRGTYAFNKGKVCYQVKLVENNDISHLEDEPSPNVLRAGWSALGATLQLGEEPLSYGYGGTGKSCVNCKFADYGSSFNKGDVVTAYLELTDSEALISFSVNEAHHDVAFTIPMSELDGKALAPHLLTKNVEFEVNFGQSEPWFPLKEGFTFVNQVPLEDRVAGPARPETRAECEMIMMCGLPGCGKTTWALEHMAKNPEKMYNIIGTNALIDKMKVMGLPRKGNYSGRWDVLIDRCTKCLEQLMDIGCGRRRNFILDQTNVYPAAQRRKMRNFEGFSRKAVVIVPTDEEFKRRVEKRELQEGKDVPDSAVMDMKANFTLPPPGLFNEVIYTELADEEAKTLVEKYNKEAIDAGHVRRGPGTPRNNRNNRQDHQYPPKRPRYGDFRRGPPMPPGGGYRRNGPPPPPPGRGWPQRGPDRWRDGYNRGPPMGGYRGGNGMDRGMNRMDRGGMGGGGWRGAPSGPSSRPRDYDRSRPSNDRSFGGRSSGPPSRSGSSQSSSYDRRDSSRDSRSKPQGSSSYGNSVGSTGGSVTSAGGSWSSYGQQPTQQWGQQAQQQTQQQNWGNNQWGSYWGKGYNQTGYGQGYQAQGYTQQQPQQQQQYGDWQQQYGNYGQNWTQQNWLNWYGGGAQQQAPVSSQPPPK